MITQAESGLSAANYAAVQAATGDISIKVELQRSGPVWSSHDTESRSGDWFDAIQASTWLVRAYSAEQADVSCVSDSTVSTIVETLQSEVGSDYTWQAATITLTGAKYKVKPSLVANGSEVYLFYVNTNDRICYRKCDSIGAAPAVFGAEVDVGAATNCEHLAATSHTKVHYVTSTSSANHKLHYYEYSGASWSNTDSDVYWPFPIYAMDAATVGGKDLIMFAAEMSPYLSSRAVGTQVTSVVNRVQGIVRFWESGGRWSDHDAMDVIDNIEVYPSRQHLRLSFEGGYAWCTYMRRGGTGDYTYTKTAVMRSMDGDNWEFPEFIEGEASPCVILPRDNDYLYVVGVNETKRSPMTTWAGQSPTATDVTDYVIGLESNAANIRNTSVALSNPADVLSGTLAKTEDRVEAVYHLGYYSGSALQVQTSTEDLVQWQDTLQMPQRQLKLATSDRLSRLNRIRSDFAAEWPGQQAGRDAYNDPTGTGYGGLRHTAPYLGSWKASGGECDLVSANMQALAVSTFVSNALSGSARTGFQLNYTDKEEYAGVAFHIYDKDNFFHASYYADDDVIRLKKMAGGIETTLAASAAMGWTIDGSNWYYIWARVHYGMIYVYTSTDGITYTALAWDSGDGELDGVLSPESEFIGAWTGKFGLVGYSYSDADDWPSWDPIPWPVPGVEHEYGMILYDQTYVGRSSNFFDVDEDANWENISSGLSGTLYRIALGPSQQAWCTTSDGVYYTVDIEASPIRWTQIMSTAAGRAAATGDDGSGTFGALDIGPDGTVYIGWANFNYVLCGYFSGTAGGLSYTRFAAYSASVCNVTVRNTGCGYAAYAEDGVPRFGCYAGGCADGLLWSAGTYTDWVSSGHSDGQVVRAVCKGFVQTWNGYIYSGYNPASLVVTPTGGGTGEHGVDALGGLLLYHNDGDLYLGTGTTSVAAAGTVFGHSGMGSGRAIFTRQNANEVAWATRTLYNITVNPERNVIVWTNDRFTNFYDRTGDWATAINVNWMGVDGSARGSAAPIQYIKHE